jgi:hypothetical protein
LVNELGKVTGPKPVKARELDTMIILLLNDSGIENKCFKKPVEEKYSGNGYNYHCCADKACMSALSL